MQQDNLLRCYSVSRLIQAFRSTLVSVVPSILGLPNIASDIWPRDSWYPLYPGVFTKGLAASIIEGQVLHFGQWSLTSLHKNLFVLFFFSVFRHRSAWWGGDILVVVGSPCVILVLLQTFSHRLETQSQSQSHWSHLANSVFSVGTLPSASIFKLSVHPRTVEHRGNNSCK